MAMKLRGLEAAVTTFREVDRRFTSTAALAVENGAKDIAELARQFAPVDRGDLTKAIRARRYSDLVATKWRITVAGAVGGRDIDAYALLVHERFMVTRGEKTKGEKGFNPGARSREKARSLGVPVGGKFLYRAAKALEKPIAASIREALRRESNIIPRRSVKRRR